MDDEDESGQTEIRYWSEILPNEMRLLVVKQADLPTRKSLRLCSWKDKALIESIPLRVLHGLEITFTMDRLFGGNIQIHHLGPLSMENGKNWGIVTDSAREADNYLLEQIEKFDYINELKIDIGIQNNNVVDLFASIPKNLVINVKSLSISSRVDTSVVVAIIKKTEPEFLKQLSIDCSMEVPNYELSSLPQVTNAESLFLNVNWMNDEELLNLKATRFIFLNSRAITADGVVNFIKKSLLELDTNDLEFTIGFDFDLNYFIESLHHQFQVTDIFDSRCSAMRISSEFPDVELEVLITENLVKGKKIVGTADGDGRSNTEHEKRNYVEADDN